MEPPVEKELSRLESKLPGFCASYSGASGDPYGAGEAWESAWAWLLKRPTVGRTGTEEPHYGGPAALHIPLSLCFLKDKPLS